MTEKKHKCHDCGVEAGELHKKGCDWEICGSCGGQLLSCFCNSIGIQRIPFGTVREIAARIPYYDDFDTIDRSKKELLEAIHKGLW